ncbi:SIMPL domain-containing protein [Pseudochelatococcus sp. B33]
MTFTTRPDRRQHARKQRSRIGGATLAAFIGGAIVGLAAWPLTAAAQQGDTAQQRAPRVISVAGEGVVEAVPDMASVVIGVVTQAKTAREAVSENSAATEAVLASLNAAAIEKRDVATSGFSVQPRYNYPRNGSGEAPKIDGYEARNTLTVRVRDLAKLGGILDTAVTTGSNQIGGISFDVAEKTPLLDKARSEAVADARRKADIFATAAGVKLGRVLAIETGSLRSPPRPMYARADALAASAPVPVEAGEQSFRATVEVTWEIVD